MAEYCDICHSKMKDPRKSACGHWFCGIHFESTNAGGITGRYCPIDCKILEISKDKKRICSCKREMEWIEAMNNPTSCPHGEVAEAPLPFPIQDTQEHDAAWLDRPATEEILARDGDMMRAVEGLEEQAIMEKQVKGLEAKLMEEEERREKAEKDLAKEKVLGARYADAFRKLKITYRNVDRDLRSSTEAPPPRRGEMEEAEVDNRQPEGASAPPTAASIDLHPATVHYDQAEVKVTIQMVEALDSSLAHGGGVEKMPTTFRGLEVENKVVE
ncbi:uncharacterized protein [Branchiostoma lanceolatum]|uniref:uncharacterized protein n=1 Tax=Branchiostoma lanceolatum TaxID=7740 RepID=UPI0034550936